MFAETTGHSDRREANREFIKQIQTMHVPETSMKRVKNQLRNVTSENSEALCSLSLILSSKGMIYIEAILYRNQFHSLMFFFVVLRRQC